MTPFRMLLIGMVLLFFWFFLFGDQGGIAFRKLLSMKGKLLEERSQLTTEIDELSAQREFLRDPSNLEPVIREELGSIRPGEIIFQERPAPLPSEEPSSSSSSLTVPLPPE